MPPLTNPPPHLSPPPLALPRSTCVEIDLDQLERNIAALREYVGAGVGLAPVVKADAYGHGAVVIAGELERMGVGMGVEMIAVALVSEALELRRHGIRAPILVMGYTENEYLDLAVRESLSITIFEYEQAVLLSREAGKQGRVAKVHIKVDTGFHRLGKEPSDAFADEIARMKALPHLDLEGIFSHLRLADRETDARQFDALTAFIDQLRGRGIQFRYAHISDSIGAVRYKEYALDMVRPGAIVYGYVPKSQVGMIDVKPIMTLKTKVTRVQVLRKGDGLGYDEAFKAAGDTVVATLPVGYADGYTRALSRVGEVLIRGKRARILGLLCMDQMMVDATAIEGVAPGDEAVLFGPVEGAPSVEELAALAKTNKNSIVAAISRRVPRVYLKNGSVYRVVDYLAAP